MLLNRNAGLIFFFLGCFVAVSLFLIFPLTNVRAIPNPVVLENQLPGSTNWQPEQIGLTFSNDVTKQIKGFASATSVNKGSPIDFFITSDAPTYTIDIYRIGWYNNAGGRLMNSTPITLSGVVQPACTTDSQTGMISCLNWSKSYTLNTGTNWTSGIYVAHLITNTHFHDYIIFVVRDDNRTADLLFQQSVTTYQAYNNYPNDQMTGKSLYGFLSYGAPVPGATNTVAPNDNIRSVQVSFDRPYAIGTKGHGDGEFFSWEIHMVRWLEQSGYDVTYSTNIDTHTDPNRLKTVKGFISTGHDEYYTKQMYDAVVAARDAGVNLGFFGANDIYGQIRLGPNAAQVPNRVQTYYRYFGSDPIADKSLEAIPWRHLSVNPRPEQGLIGIQYSGHDTWDDASGSGKLAGGGDAVDYIPSNTSNWTYANTGLISGVAVPRIVGYETDRDMSADIPGASHPTNTLSYDLLSHSPYISYSHKKEPDYANSVIYQAQSGAWVFGAGSIAWAWGLDNWRFQNFANFGIQQMTANILNKFISGSGTNQTISPVADAYIAADAPDTKLGQFPFLYVNGSPNTVRKTFLRFDLTPFVGKNITSAVLKLTTTASNHAGSTGIQNLHLLTNNTWNESTLTWNNSPQTAINSAVIGSLNGASQLSTSYPITLDLATVQAQVGNLFSLVIDSASNNDIVFGSKEASNSPQLNLTFNASSSASPSATPSPSPTPAAQYRIFNNITPAFIQTDPNAIELGVKFRSTQAGKILGIRFYKGAGNTGVHTGTVWTSTGANLATATFTNETATGWQEVFLPTPIIISPNTTYIASYHTTTGHFAQKVTGFSTAINSGPLTALQDGFDGLNGVFLYGNGGFPNSSWNASNYYVDVIFQ